MVNRLTQSIETPTDRAKSIMKQIERLSYRQTLQDCLGTFVGSSAKNWVDQGVNRAITTLPNSPSANLDFKFLVLPSYIPQPKYSLFDSVKAFIANEEVDIDVYHYFGIITGLRWQPDNWNVREWVYQILVLKTDDPLKKLNSVIEFLESEISPDF